MVKKQAHKFSQTIFDELYSWLAKHEFKIFENKFNEEEFLLNLFDVKNNN